MCRAIRKSITLPVAKKPTLRKRPRQHRVRFGATAETTFAQKRLSEEEINNRWYSKVEEQSFRLNAVRDFAHSKRDNTIEIPRGLERHTKERRNAKKQTIKMILFAQSQGFTPEDIASVSKDLGSWNTQIAANQAHLDRLEVLCSC